MEISITRALAELKLSDKKIEQRTEKIISAAAVKVDLDAGDFAVDSKASIQSVTDMISRRNLIKRQIVIANANTTVTIGKVQITVAEAIERKTSIQLSKDLYKKVRESYFSEKRQVDHHNKAAQEQAVKLAENILSASTDKDKGEAYNSIVQAHMAKNSAKLVSYDGIEADIDKMQDEIDEFECEVDFILSESNTRTMITI